MRTLENARYRSQLTRNLGIRGTPGLRAQKSLDRLLLDIGRSALSLLPLGDKWATTVKKGNHGGRPWKGFRYEIVEGPVGFEPTTPGLKAR